MSDAYNFIYSDDPRTGALTYPQLEARRKIAIALATRNRPYPKTIGEGLTALGEGLGEGMYNARTVRDETAYQRQSDAEVQRLTGQGATPAAPRAAPGGASLESADPATQAYAYAPPDTGPVFDPSKLSPEDRQKLAQAREYSGPQMPMEEWKTRIARNESGGSKDPYTLVGERSRRGDYPYGKYQVMGENIPKWTRAHYGQELTPQEFLANKDAQEAVATGQGNLYMAKYGPDGAGRAWFAGEKGMNDPNRKDTLGTHVAEYSRRFNIPLVSRDQVVASAARAPVDPESAAPFQVASLGGGVPTPDTAPNPARDAIAQSLVEQQQPAPQQQPPELQPVQVAQAPQQQFPIGTPAPRPQAVQPQAPPPPPQTPMTQQEIDIRRAIGASADPTFRGRLEPYADRMAEERKFKDVQNMKAWEKDYAAWEKTTDPVYQQQLKKAQQGIVTDIPGRQPVDPNIGTPLSMQKSGIPRPPPRPPNITDDKWAELQAPEMAKKIDAADKAKLAFDEINSVLHQARTHPGREWGIGPTAKIAAAIPGSDAAGFAAINEQISGKTFLEAYQIIKGAGAISEKEGAKAEQAIARLSTSQNKRDYDKALYDLETVVRTHYEAAQRAVNRPVTAWRKPGDNSTYAPDIGEVRDGKRYVGGKPSDPMNWE